MTTFFLIRHAHCDGVGEILWGRSRDVHLNECGKSEARALAQRVAEHRLDTIYSSPLERAVETAEEIAQQSGGIPVNISDALNELDYGQWTGQTIAGLKDDPVWQRFNTVRSRTRIPGGESIFEAQARIVAELRRLFLQHENGRVAIVSHADMLKVALAYFSSLHVDRLDQLHVPPCSVNVLDLTEMHPRAMPVNV
jgi:broad specificity phosphatase PhoE